MLSFKNFIKEANDGSVTKQPSHHVMAFGRMNPITSGHEAVVNKLHSVAKENGATHSLVVSHSQDAKKNPLTAEQKVKHAKNAFPGTNVTAASKESPTILHHAAAAHAAGATHLHVIAGSDRHEEMHNLLHKYNGKDSAHGHYNFKSIKVHSSGQRDADSEHDEKKPESEEEKKKKQVQSISASKMRGFAAAGNKKEFHANAPSKMKPEHKDAMYNDVRKGMNIKEETQIDELKHSTVSNYMRRARTQLSNIEVSRRSSGDEKFAAEKARRRANTLNKIADKTDSRAVRDQLQKATAFVKEQAPVAPVPDRKYIKGTPENKALRAKNKPINGHPTNVKEETVDQQTDRAQQLKRFKDQMTSSNGPQIDTEIALDKKEKAIMTGKVKPKNKTELGLSKTEKDNLADVNEHLTPEMGAGGYINDFIKSTNPRFNNKSKEERRKMAIGAYMAAKAKGVKEHIEKVKGGYEVESEHGNKNLGKSKSFSAAKKRLKQVEYFKHMHEEHDDQYEMAQEFKKTAEQSKAAGNHGAYHAHMANHHDHVGQWHEKKGRSAAAEREYDKAAEHHEQSLKHPYISESFSSIEHNGDHKKITHGDDFNIMIGKEHHAKISGLEHGERHVFKCKEGNEYGCWRSNDHLHFKRHSGDSGLHSNMSVIIPVAQWNNQDAMGQDKPVTEETIVESAPFKDLKSAVHYASEKVKTHRDHLDGVEVYKHKAGGYDVNHTMNANGRNALHGSGAKHLGTVYRDKQFNIKHNIKEETINELSTDLLARYKTASHASAKAADQAGNYAKGDKRFKGINKATIKQFDNDLKKHGQFKEDIYSSDTRTKKVQVQDKDGNWVFKDRKSHPHKINFAASKMNGKPAQVEDPTKDDTETNYQKYMDKQKKQNEAWVLNPTGKSKKKYKDIKDNKTLSNSITTPPFDAFSNTNNQT